MYTVNAYDSCVRKARPHNMLIYFNERGSVYVHVFIIDDIDSVIGLEDVDQAADLI